jgi:hypothetical protein
MVPKHRDILRDFRALEGADAVGGGLHFPRAIEAEDNDMDRVATGDQVAQLVEGSHMSHQTSVYSIMVAPRS